jgi:propionyl-CoA carboxylase alpha chain
MRRLLLANRGEIARRIQRTARAMGLHTVAVFVESDRDMPFVHEADQAVRVESYLGIESILAAARRTRADAIHPGYGFLSENAAFARACGEAGFTFVGPTPEAIEAMGSKPRALRVAEEAGIPTLATRGDEFPLLVKASAGGGGRGMRLVRVREELDAAIDSAKREAKAAFGDDTVYLERYLEGARHLEVQLAADHHGHVIHLFERECSIQRRHQKLIEEAPATCLSDAVKQRLYEAALQFAHAIDYTNLGTVEFLVKGDEIAFLEMNTRLQVEHPVTEAITGLDLVRLQLELAEGDQLPSTLQQRGYAIEARLYSEDPARDFLPSIGTLHRFEHDDSIRWDSGVESGSLISPDFDGLLAKAVAHAATRDEALRKLSRSLRAMQIHGVQTNRDALVAVLECSAFQQVDISTEFLEQHPELLSSCIPEDVARAHAEAASLVLRHQRQHARRVLRFVPPGWRNVPTHPPEPTAEVASISEEHVDVELDGVQRRYHVAVYGEDVYVNTTEHQTRMQLQPRFVEASDTSTSGGPVAPLPGTVSAVLVQPGERVQPGQTLVVLAAMKIEHQITADAEATVREVRVQPGQKVGAHEVLVVLEP